MAKRKKRKKQKEKKDVAYRNGTYAYEEGLPYPIVLYPNFYGFPFAFKENENCRESFLCECSRKAVMNFVKIINMTNHDAYNIMVSYQNQFPYEFLNYLREKYNTSDFGHILINHSNELYKEGLCHYCNKTIPSYAYCLPMYGSKFVQQFGWYIKLKQIEYGIFNETIIFPDMIPNILQKYIAELENLSPYKDKERISEINKILYNYPENIVRENWGVKPIGRRWDTETKLFDYVDNIFKNERIYFHFRPDWLDGLELDIYVSSYNLGIEYQGIQHYKPLKHWGGEPGFAKRRANDIRKKNLCEQNGVRLIYFYYYEDITEELVMERLLPYIN